MPSPFQGALVGLSRISALAVAVIPIFALGALALTALAVPLLGQASPIAGGAVSIFIFTFAVAASSAVLGGGIGAGCAIAAEELATPAIRAALRGAAGMLALLPAVAFGWFAFVALAPAIARHPGGREAPFVAAVALLSSMVAPGACTLVAARLRRIPAIARHAAAAAGAGGFQTLSLIVLPALSRDIGAAMLAAFARAAGEATALTLMFVALARAGVPAAATAASWILTQTAFGRLDTGSAAQLSSAALILFVLAAAIAFFTADDLRGARA